MQGNSYVTVPEVADSCGLSYTGLEQHLLFYHKDLVKRRIRIRKKALRRQRKGEITGRGTVHAPSPELVEKYAEAVHLYATTPMSAARIAGKTGVSKKGFYEHLQRWHLDLPVCNAGSYSTMAVAQHTFALMLHHFSRIAAYDRAVRAGAWEKSLQFSWFPYPTAELAGKTLCVVGYGSIGKTVAKIGQVLGMQIKITTRTTPTDCPFPVISMEEAFQTADVLTIHTPLTPETQHLVNAERLASMKPTAFLINTARGGIVDETALAEALRSGVIAGAAVDVLDTEPMSDQTPLRQLPNCTITPHVAWAAVETRKRLLQIVTENVAAYLNGTPQNVVS